jgi:hypothetical protein
MTRLSAFIRGVGCAFATLACFALAASQLAAAQAPAKIAIVVFGFP